MAGEKHPEAFYQEIWCNQHQGVHEYVLEDRTRVDCLTDQFAVELDFARKWYSGVGQSLHYARKTGKSAGLVLIVVEERDLIYTARAKDLIEFYDLPIRLWVMRY
jgi:hypothetical protein